MSIHGGFYGSFLYTRESGLRLRTFNSQAEPHMKISQREAQRLRKRVLQLESEVTKCANAWAHEWPGGVNIDIVNVNYTEYKIVSTARKLGHAVVVVPKINGSSHQFLVYACPLPKS